ncbi:MAG: cyclodeaminase/cyclohydrolase family protein [Clostridia bacterium]|nr:cyclodeaminase/cyclohydrolase family protein [Clostridia bacterium]
MLKELTVEQFVSAVASSSPAPGGGSVAALAGAQAAGLLSMYCNLSQNRDKLGDLVGMLQKAGEEARFLKTKLLEAIDEDTAAFNRVMDVYRLSKDSEAEKTERAKAIQAAAAYAAAVPLQTARDSFKILSIVCEVAAKGNPAAITDLGVANLQALAALIGACYNVRINLGMLTDKKLVGEFNCEIDEILKQGQESFDINRTLIEKEIG